MKWYGIAAAYFATVNAAAFALMGIDKRRARRHERRIPEKTLFLFPLLGGCVGGLAGMYGFHHKTRHWYFRFGFPAILIVWLAAGLLCSALRAGDGFFVPSVPGMLLLLLRNR